jgi:hypothetical protein
MTPARRWLLALAASSIALAAWALPRERPSAAELVRCRATDGPRTAPIDLYSGSRLRSDGMLEAGKRVGCSESSRSARATVAAREALLLVPHHLRPQTVRVHLDPALPSGAVPIATLETHTESASLFARSSGAADLDPSVWLHEFAHLRARGTRPHGRIERRIYAAIEEGVADYYAAVIRGSPRLSGEDGARDLERPPRVPAEYWVTLLNPVFDPHPFGWELAAALWRIDSKPGPLLDDLVEGLSADSAANDLPGGADTTPADVARSFVMRCPARSRRTITQALARAFGVELESELERTER